MPATSPRQSHADMRRDGSTTAQTVLNPPSMSAEDCTAHQDSQAGNGSTGGSPTNVADRVTAQVRIVWRAGDEDRRKEKNDPEPRDPVSVRTLHMTSGLDGISRAPGPRQELVKPIDGVSADHAPEHVDEIGVGLEAVELGDFDQRADDRPTLAAAVASRKEMILPAKGYGTNRALDRIDVEFDAAVMQKARQSVPTGKRITDRFGERAAPDTRGSCASSQSRKASAIDLEKDCRSARRRAGD